MSRRRKVTDGTPNPELPNMPALDTCGKLAMLLIQANDEIAEGHRKREEIQDQLIEALTATDRREIRVNGKIVSIKHVDATDKIQIKTDAEPELL